MLLTRAGAGADPAGPLVVDDAGTSLDGPTLEDGVARLAGGLRAAGVRRGDVVAWQAPNHHEVVLLYRACWRLGAVAGPIHHQAGPAEVERMLDVLTPRLWLPRPEVLDPAGRVAALVDVGAPVTRSAARPADVAVVLFTSGSSGGPKAALHTQRGLGLQGPGDGPGPPAPPRRLRADARPARAHVGAPQRRCWSPARCRCRHHAHGPVGSGGGAADHRDASGSRS